MSLIGQQLNCLSRDVLYPILSTALVHYSNDKGHPFEVQYVAGWITSSVFHESRNAVLKFFLSGSLFATYTETFWTSLGKLHSYQQLARGDTLEIIIPRLTWMESLNVCGNLYLAMSWLYMMAVAVQPRLLRYRKKTSTAFGIMYIVVTLAIYRKYKRTL